MKTNQNSPAHKHAALQISRVHFVYAFALIIQVLLYDAFKLIELDVVLKRWSIALVILTVSVTLWYFAKTRATDKTYVKMIWLLTVTDILAASYSVYLQRGLASRSAILYVIPLLTISFLKQRSAVTAAAVLSVIGYAAAAISYFVIHFNEGYKIELYGEVGFYSCILLLLSSFIWLRLKATK